MDYDVIGDVHGHATELRTLLQLLGYAEKDGAHRHPARKAVFVGDLIDRGDEQLATVDLVRRMVDAGSALAVMGNHELNAIAWFLEDPDEPGEYLRPHRSPRYGAKNRAQHAAFLREVEGKPIHAELIGWFLTLPVWLDLPELRVVHACWHPAALAHLKERLGSDRRLSEALMVEASREPEDPREKDTPAPTLFKAVEWALKGVEIPCPAGFSFADKDGHDRSRVRVAWWDDRLATYHDAALGLDGAARARLPRAPIPDHARLGYADPKPVFFGHYWRKDPPTPVTARAACVDYSIGHDHQLCAYTFEGEPVLEARRFTAVNGTRYPAR